MPETLKGIVPRSGFASPIAALQQTPILRGKKRQYYEFQFPALTLNRDEFNSEVFRTPGDAWFLCRQILYTVQVTNQPSQLGRARISSASERRPNFAWTNELVSLELLGSTNPRTPHYLWKPTLIEPNSAVTLEVQNIDTSQHVYHVTLVGELIWGLTEAEIAHFTSYAWFGYAITFSPNSNQATIPNIIAGRNEIRTHPDADFYITHLVSTRFGPSNAAGTGPTRTKIILGSQGEPIMDNPINNDLLFGSYYNLTVVPVTSIGPTPLPYPIRIPANSSIIVQATQADAASSSGDEEILFEGIKVFT